MDGSHIGCQPAGPYIVLTCKCRIPDVQLDVDNKTQSDVIIDDDLEDKSTPVEIWAEEIRHQLHRRGFHVEASFSDKDHTHGFLLSIDCKRFQMLDACRDNKGYENLSTPERFRLAQDSFDILYRLISINFGFNYTKNPFLSKHKDSLRCSWYTWLAHDSEELKANTLETPSRIRDYYGNKIAIYFAFLNYYTRCLVLLGVVGLLVFFHEVTESGKSIWSIGSQIYSTADVDSKFLPWLGLTQAIWGTLFLAFWRLNESALLRTWNVSQQEASGCNRKVTEIKAPVSSPAPPISLLDKRILLFGSICWITCLLMLSIWFIAESYVWDAQIAKGDLSGSFLGLLVYLKMHSIEIMGTRLLTKVPLLFRVLFPMLFSPLFNYIAEKTTEFEEHAYLSRAENYNIVKKFSFQFVTNYCGLFYIAFIKRDLGELRSSLLFILSINACINNFFEWTTDLSTYFVNLAATNVYNFDIKGEHNSLQIALRKELTLGTANIDDEFLEMAIQFGFVTMFAVVFPLAPLFAVTNNLFEGTVDLKKLRGSKRYGLQINRSRIGVWQRCFEFISFFSVITNVYLLCICSKQVQRMSIHKFIETLVHDSFQANIIVMILFEHLIFGLKFVLNHLLAEDDENGSRSNVDITDSKLKQLSMEPSARYDSPGESTTKSPKKDVVDPNSHISQKSITSRVVEEDFEFSRDPMLLLSAFVIAPLCNATGLSIYWYLPFAAAVFQYFNLAQNKEIHRQALQLSCDDQVIKVLLDGYMPPWIQSGCYQKVDWLNTTLEKLWPFLGPALGNVICGSVNPILAEVCVSLPILKMLLIERISFGENAPTINSIYFDKTEESLVRLDLNISWPSNIFALLKVRLAGAPLPLSIELSKVMLKCVLRIELLEFTSAGLACFKILTISFTNKPTLTFSLKLSSLDVMNVGLTKDLNVTTIVENLLRGILQDIMVYPNKISIPLYPDTNLADVSTLPPNGILLVTIQEARKLKAADWNGLSDPYVLVKLTQRKTSQSTKVMYKNLNPKWDNENLEFFIARIESEVIEFWVYDFDMLSSHDVIGFYSIPLVEALKQQDEQGMLLFDLFESKDCSSNGCKKHGLKLGDCLRDGHGQLKVSVAYTALLSGIDEKLLSAQELYVRMEEGDDIIGESQYDEMASAMSRRIFASGQDDTVGLLTVSSIRCRNIKSTAKTGILSGKPKPYHIYAKVEILFNETDNDKIRFERQRNYFGSVKEKENQYTRRTVTGVKGETAHHFPDSFSFVLREVRPEKIMIMISMFDDRNGKNDKLLGRHTVFLQDLTTFDPKLCCVESEYELEYDHIPGTESPSRYVGVKVDWRVAKTRK